MNGARLIARPSAHSVLFETADGGGVVYWQKLILCCGARELSLPFPGWTLPGVTGAGGLQAQIKHGLSLKGEKVVIAGSGPLLLAVADTVNKAGGDVTNIIEQAPLPALLRFASGLWRWPQKLRQLATLAPKGYLSGAQAIRAHGTTRLEAVTLRQRGVERTIACDRLAIGYGLIPNIETALLFGCATAQEAIGLTAGSRPASRISTPPASAPASAVANWRWRRAKSPVLPPPGPAIKRRRYLPAAPAGSASPTP